MENGHRVGHNGIQMEIEQGGLLRTETVAKGVLRLQR